MTLRGPESHQDARSYVHAMEESHPMSADPSLMRWNPSDAEQTAADISENVRTLQYLVATNKADACPACGGCGRWDDIPCFRCNGTGRI